MRTARRTARQHLDRPGHVVQRLEDERRVEGVRLVEPAPVRVGEADPVGQPGLARRVPGRPATDGSSMSMPVTVASG